MQTEISWEDAKDSNKLKCGNCEHSLSHHIFWNNDKAILELWNCNECSCSHFIAGGKFPKSELCECGHEIEKHSWKIPSTGEVNKFKESCGECDCKKFNCKKYDPERELSEGEKKQ